MAGSGRRRAEVPRSRAPLLLLVVALLGIGATVAASALTGPLGTADSPADSGSTGQASGRGERDGAGSGAAASSADGSPAPEPTPVEVDLSNLPIRRTLDCDRLDGDPVREALGAPVTVRDGYTSGDRVEVSPGITDVVAEDGCVFRSPGADARVWVFSAPVGTAFARTLVRQARRAPGCTPRPDETGFGSPTLTDVCRTASPRAASATLRGLFGDAWLSCRLSVEDEDEAPDAVLDRAQRWCVEVAATLGARS